MHDIIFIEWYGYYSGRFSHLVQGDMDKSVSFFPAGYGLRSLV
jgi:hypothetical protein